MAQVAEPVAQRIVLPLAIRLTTLLGWAIALGLIFMVRAVLIAFFHFTESVVGNTIGWIPGAGKWVKGKIEGAEHKAVSTLGDAAHSLEGRVADAFHASADLTRSIGHEIEGLSLAVWRVAWYMHNVVKPQVIHGAIAGLHASERALRAAEAAILRREGYDRKAIQHSDTGPIAAGTKTLIKPIASRNTWQGAQIHALQGGYALPRAIPHPGTDKTAREQAKTAEQGLESVWGRLRDVSRRTAGLGAVALVTVAMGRLGLGWFRCSNVTKAARRLCRMDPRALDEILGLTLVVVGTISIVEFAKELQTVVGEAADDVHRLIRDK